MPIAEVDASAQSSLDRCGLFGDFFVHEVRVVADVGEAALGLQGYGDFVDRGTDDANDLEFVAVDSNGFAVVDVDHLFDVGRHRGGVAGQDVCIAGIAEDEASGVSDSDSDDLVGFAGGHCEDHGEAVEFGADAFGCLKEGVAVLHESGNHVGEGFGVGFGGEFDAFGGQ